MKKVPVLIKIETLRSQLMSAEADDGRETEALSSTGIGYLLRTRQGYRLDIGASDSYTVIDTASRCVSVSINAEVSSALVFRENETCTGTYSTPDQLLQVMTYTYSVRDDLHDTGGSLTLDYEVMLAGSVCERCRTTYTPCAVDAPAPVS